MTGFSGTLGLHSSKNDRDCGRRPTSMLEALTCIPSFVSAQLKSVRSWLRWQMVHNFHQGIPVRLPFASNGLELSVA
jgi:hypothetical protein